MSDLVRIVWKLSGALRQKLCPHKDISNSTAFSQNSMEALRGIKTQATACRPPEYRPSQNSMEALRGIKTLPLRWLEHRGQVLGQNSMEALRGIKTQLLGRYLDLTFGQNSMEALRGIKTEYKLRPVLICAD